MGPSPEPSFEAVERMLEQSDAAADAAASSLAASALAGLPLPPPAPPPPAVVPAAGHTARLAAALRAVGEQSHGDDLLDRTLHLLTLLLRALAAALSALSHTNAAWLRARRRKRWWKRRVFPQVPMPQGKSEVVLDWPLLHKAAPLALLFFAASFNLVLLSASKDALIVTAPGGGVEVRHPLP